MDSSQESRWGEIGEWGRTGNEEGSALWRAALWQQWRQCSSASLQGIAQRLTIQTRGLPKFQEVGTCSQSITQHRHTAPAAKWELQRGRAPSGHHGIFAHVPTTSCRGFRDSRARIYIADMRQLKLATPPAHGRPREKVCTGSDFLGSGTDDRDDDTNLSCACASTGA